MNKDIVLISVACIFKNSRGKQFWLVAKPKEDADWELPRVAVRKAESSARASIRMAGEQLGVTAKVLEEAGRAGGAALVNNKTVPQRHLYYLLIHEEESGEPLMFNKIAWLEYAKAVRKLTQKRDRQMLKAAKEELRVWTRVKKPAIDEKERKALGK